MPEINHERLPNREAIASFNGKVLLTTQHYAELKAYEHALAFTVARIADKDMLTEVHKAMKQAIENGTSFADFKKALKPYLMAKGWLAPTFKNDNVDDDKEAFRDYQKHLGHRLRTIYHTNKATAYAGGQWERIQRTKELLPYLQYMPSVSANKRDNHKQFYGMVRPVDDPIWASIMPPNGFGCKCWVKQLTKTRAKKILDEQAEKGIVYDIDMEQVKHPLTGEMMTVPKGVHFSFNHNHDRLTALLKLAEEKHGKEFADGLAFESLEKYTNIDKAVFFKSDGKDGEFYPKEKLAKLIKVFDKQGIPYLIGEEGGRFAKQMGAEAVYFPTEVGMSGFFAFPENPTRTQVIEELLHYGQHKSTNFASLEWQDIVQFEIQAQKKLLTVGRLLGWTVAELEQIERALAQWQQEWEKLK
ncbi:phage head morphogenesis protein, SPP1 gp7 family [Moraxella lacunata]|uniref:Phage head morphogenesis protein, SPP1 gp7 family n=1 Tax=Moraxella lacunata TaxID=477 RepID=A0A378TVZ0_MORLA|nr:phage minor head protein [Moraxella lacunata]STZ63923.1 phage head morphogenesis protein, SPP1 gp7 family [Moraxella lacunata]